jgi:site-specific DNA recombinase
VSLPEQREAIEQYAAKNGLNVSQWFEERKTAAKRGRPIWNDMLKLLRKGKAQGVLIHKIDRSARNLKDWADLGDCIDQGIEVHFVNEALDLNSRGGRLSADIQAVVAADYIRNLREEAKKGIYGRLKQGFYPSRAPIGYLDNGAAKVKTIDPVKGSLVRKAFELYSTTRFSIPILQDELFRLGLRNHAGGKVTRNGVDVMLNNPFYIGLIRIKRTGETFQGNHEALISKHLFDRCQDILHGRFNTRTKIHEFPFRRIVKCFGCGYSLIGELQKNRVYYRCHTRSCPTISIREVTIEALVIAELTKLTFSVQELRYLTERNKELKERWVHDKELALMNLRVKYEQITERLTRLTDAYLDQTVEKDLFEERKVALLFERQAVSASIKNLSENGTSIPLELQKFIELAGDMYSLYRMASPEKKRRLVKMVTSNFSCREKTLDFAFKEPFETLAKREKSINGRPSKAVHRTLDKLLTLLAARISAMPLLSPTAQNDLSQSMI